MASAWKIGCHFMIFAVDLPRAISKLGTSVPSSRTKTILGAEVETASTMLKSVLDHAEQIACSGVKAK